METIPVTDAMFSVAIRAVQLATMAPSLLSRQTVNTLLEVVDICLDFGAMASTTKAQWAVVTTAHDALVKHFTDEVAA